MTEHTVVTRDEWIAARKNYQQLLNETPRGRRDDARAYRHDEYPDAS